MNNAVPLNVDEFPSGSTVRRARASAAKNVDATIGGHAEALSTQLQSISAALFPPTAQKKLRRFTSGEVARLIGVNDSRIRQVALAGEGPQPELSPNGRRLYTLGQINQLRAHFAQIARGVREARDYLPHRQSSDHLQVIAVTNFKGGSGKTTTAAHLSQYFALRGYRVLAIDLDPQASLSALFGLMPEVEVGPNETLYGAIRYDRDRRPLSEILRQTYFDGLDIVPGNLELMEFEHETPRALIAGMRRPEDMFFARVAQALDEIAERYDLVIIDCPPQLGYLTLAGLCAATGMLITVHPQMLDVASMSQFLLMTRDLLAVVREAGGAPRLRLHSIFVDTIRASGRTADKGCGAIAQSVWRSRADKSHGQDDGSLGRRAYQANSLRDWAGKSYALDL